jgi:hypothetical protein
MIWHIAAISKQLACSPGRHVIVPDRQSKLMVAVRASKNANLGTATRYGHDRDQVRFKLIRQQLWSSPALHDR